MKHKSRKGKIDTSLYESCLRCINDAIQDILTARFNSDLVKEWLRPAAIEVISIMRKKLCEALQYWLWGFCRE